MDDLGVRRTRRWWQTGRPIRSIARAGAFIDDVGFALLFPTPGMALPSLYEAACERPVPPAELAWGPDAQRVWGWKDELPRKGLAWSGRLLGGGRASFLAPDLLADCYPRAGEPDDFRQAPLGEQARRIAETLLASGPLPTAVLRRAVGLQDRRGGVRFAAAVVQLGRTLVCTSCGTEQVGSGWPSVVLELTARAFDPQRPRPGRGGAATAGRAPLPGYHAGGLRSPAGHRLWLAAGSCPRRAGRAGGPWRGGAGGGRVPARPVAPAQGSEDRDLTSSVRETIRVIG